MHHGVQAAAQAALAGGNPLGPEFWLSSLGAFGVFVVLFAETGLLIGFFLPGDSLLFTAGVLCSASEASALRLNLSAVLVAALAGAVVGAQAGFMLGRRGGRRLLARARNRHLHRGMARAEDLLARYGHGNAIVLARFIPVVRTVLNPLAGMLEVPVRTFVVWQVVGGIAWAVGVTLAGYGLGASIPGIDQYLMPVIAVIVFVSLMPLGMEIWRSSRADSDRDGEPVGQEGSP